MDDVAPQHGIAGHHPCRLCSVLAEGDNTELSRFIVDTLERHSLCTLYEQVPVFLHALESRQKQTRGEVLAVGYQFSEDEIHDHVQFCVGAREDSVLKLLLKQKLLRAMEGAPNVPHLVAVSKMLHQTLAPARKADGGGA
tara:strand:- start:433 stop:852 length:420 start_codon:yes stop_codon:yes gene_type:complete